MGKERLLSTPSLLQPEALQAAGELFFRTNWKFCFTHRKANTWNLLTSASSQLLPLTECLDACELLGNCCKKQGCPVCGWGGCEEGVLPSCEGEGWQERNLLPWTAPVGQACAPSFSRTHILSLNPNPNSFRGGTWSPF